MISCEECGAYVRFQDETCWHCEASLESHPARHDLRYLVAYSRFSRIILTLVTILVAFGLIAIPCIFVASLPGHRAQPLDILLAPVAVLPYLGLNFALLSLLLRNQLS